MANGVTAVSDIVVPQLFTPYVQQITEEKSRIIQSGVAVRDAFLDDFLSGGGLTINSPSFKDLDNDADLVSSDSGAASTPNKIGSATEIAVRLSRNNSWATADLASALAGTDPADAIAQRVGAYWTRRYQAAFMATMKGLLANNAAVTDAFHVQNDMTFDVKGAAYTAGVTNFTAESFIDATLTMGDSQDSLGTIFVHSIVYGRMQKNNLIDFIPDSTRSTMIPTFLGREVIVDDGMPFAAGVFESWIFGAGAVRLGMGTPKVPTEVIRVPGANNGGGQEVLHNRTELCIHPVGHAYIGAPASGGPDNTAAANMLAGAGSWKRVFSERKQVKIARLITRES